MASIFLQQTKPLSIFKILGQALKLSSNCITKNCNLIIFSFFSSSIVFFFTYLFVTPLTTDLTAKSAAIASLDPNSPEYVLLKASIIKDIKELVGIEAIFFLLTFIIYSLILFATIRVLLISLTYTVNGEFLSSKPRLDILIRKLKGLMITRLYVSLLNLGYILFLAALIGFFVHFFTISSSLKILIAAVGVVLGIVGLLVYMNLCMVWSVSVVVSVVEEGCYGLAAISKAGEVTEGRKGQGGLLVLIMTFLIGVLVCGVFSIYVYAGYNPSRSTTANLAIELVSTFVSVLIRLFEWAVIMVFYCDCKKSKGSEFVERRRIQAMEDGTTGFMYANLHKVLLD